MSSLDRDPRRKVAAPTEKDFIKGMADTVTKNVSGTHTLLVLAAGLLLGKAMRRWK